MYRNPSEPVSESAVSPWMASILMRRGGGAWQRFALYYRQLSAMPRRWRRQLRRKAAVGLGSAALVLALAGPIVAAPALQSLAPDATIVVVNGEVANVNNNKCGLIEAIINARTNNAGAMRPDCTAGNLNGPDTISLPANGDFVLTEAHNAQFGATGLPVITSAVTIEGHGATIRRSNASGTPDFRILAVDANGALTLRDTTVTNGRSHGYPTSGAGIYAQGQLNIAGSTITQNNALVWSNWGEGGGVFAGGPTTITNSVISYNATVGNSADYGDGGGIAIGRDAEATITGSTILGNHASGGYSANGGGIFVWGEVTIVNSLIAENVSHGSEDGARGGGIAVIGRATISGSTIRDNVIYSFYEYNGGEWPGYGGGLANGGVTTVTNTTISGNTAEGPGDGIFNLPFGELTVVQSTITGNHGSGIGTGPTVFTENCSTTTLRGTIISGNGAEEIHFVPTPDDSWDCFPYHDAVFNRDSFNVFGHSGNAGLVGLTPGATDIVPSVGLNAILSPLADNGGPTQTHALPANSPALDLSLIHI